MKNYDYFNAFSEQADYCRKASGLLSETFENYQNVDISQAMENMHLIENMADKKRHEIINQLVKEFLPPIEREDIMTISSSLDDIIDMIDDLVMNLYMYNIKELNHNALSMAEVIAKSSESLYLLMKEFGNFKKSKIIHDYIIDLNNFEEEGDVLHTNSVYELNKSEDILHIVNWRKIYDIMEDTCDSFENLADNISMVIMKNS